MPEVEVRCPLGPRRLFSKLRLGQVEVRYIQPDNLIEFSCPDCRRRIRADTGASTSVFHRYNFLGELIETVIAAGPHSARSD